MKQGTCVKCNSTEVYAGQLNNQDRRQIMGIFGVADLTTYMCADCGYFEDWVADTSKISKIRDKWQKVG